MRTRWVTILTAVTAVVLASCSTAPEVTDSVSLGAAGPDAFAATSAGWQATAVPVDKGDIAAVAALGEQDAWAVGYRLKGLAELEPLALRWNGTDWRQESILPADSYPTVLSVRAANDIWVAGGDTVHWDGSTWTTHALEGDPFSIVPDAVATAPDGQAWVAGRRVPGSIKDGTPVIQSWDGTRWRNQQLPDVGKGELSTLSVLGPNDVWAAGFTLGAGPDVPQATLVFHWDGSSWTRIPSPSVERSHTWIGGLTAFGTDDVWAVGGSIVETTEQPFAMHWDGKAWATTSTPEIADGRLRGVGRTATGELWALGGKGSVSVALRWNDATLSWERADDPGIVIRNFSTVPGSGALWAVGIAKQGDLVPAVSRFNS